MLEANQVRITGAPSSSGFTGVYLASQASDISVIYRGT